MERVDAIKIIRVERQLILPNGGKDNVIHVCQTQVQAITIEAMQHIPPVEEILRRMRG